MSSRDAGGIDADVVHSTVMNVRTTHRLAAVAGPVVVAALVLGACGGDDSSAATRATVTLAAGETDYQTIAPATTTTTVPGEVAAGAEQEYTVQAGDYGIKVANQFGVSLEDLAERQRLVGRET